MKVKRTNMKESLFRKIVDEAEAEGLCAMKLQSRGESLVHPKILDCLDYAKRNGILDVHITTNGLLLTDTMIEGLVSNGLDLLIISYDEAHAEASFRTRREYDEFMKSAVKKIDVCRKKKKRPLKIRIQTCTADYTPANIERLEKENRKLFPQADFFLINPEYVSYEDDPHLLDLKAYDFYPCSYLWQRLTIYADGSVTTCSRDYNCKYNRIGSVEKDSIRELWHSPAMRDLRRRHLSGNRKDFHICALCENYLVNRETGLPGAGCTGIVYGKEVIL
jgi:radical SAM protein with 4Fe4S-binding SPASM domain